MSEHLVCCVCGSPKWFACRPGTDAEPQFQGNVCILKPAPAVPSIAWCWQDWPWRTALAGHVEATP